MATILIEYFKGLWLAIEPMAPALIIVFIAWIILATPLPGRGPLRSRRDKWRGFKYGPRREVMERAGNRCEAAAFIVWGRCPKPAVEADHIYPWSKGGPTIVSNGQALCRPHNRSKGALTPPWWYVRGLERRRKKYVASPEQARVSAKKRTARPSYPQK